MKKPLTFLELCAVYSAYLNEPSPPERRKLLDTLGPFMRHPGLRSSCLPYNHPVMQAGRAPRVNM